LFWNGTTGTTPSGFGTIPSRCSCDHFWSGRVDRRAGNAGVDRLLRAVAVDRLRQVDGGALVAVRVEPLLQRRGAAAARARRVLNDHLRRVLDRDLRERVAGLDDHGRLAVLARLGVEDRGVGVEVVRLPDVPSLVVGLFGVAEAEALDVQALDGDVDNEVAPVVGEPAEEAAEGLAELRGREREPLAAGVVVLIALKRRTAGVEPSLEPSEPPFRAPRSGSVRHEAVLLVKGVRERLGRASGASCALRPSRAPSCRRRAARYRPTMPCATTPRHLQAVALPRP
jgi:hypothetical protein